MYKHICECTQKSQKRSFKMSEGAINIYHFISTGIAMTIKNQQGNNTSKTRVSNLDSLEGQARPPAEIYLSTIINYSYNYFDLFSNVFNSFKPHDHKYKQPLVNSDFIKLFL